MSRMWRVRGELLPTNSGGGINGTNACASRATRAATRSPILLTGVERISIDGPPPDGNPNLARYCTGRTAHIGVWARLVCSLAGEAALGRMANGRRTGSMHGLSRTTLIVTT